MARGGGESAHKRGAGRQVSTKRYFDSGSVAFDMAADEPRSPVKPRHFTSFSAAAREDAYSRVWLGLHFPWDAEDGRTLGDKIANHVFTTKLRPL